MEADSNTLEAYHLCPLVRGETCLSVSCEVAVDLDGVAVTALVRIYPVLTYKVHKKKDVSQGVDIIFKTS